MKLANAYESQASGHKDTVPSAPLYCPRKGRWPGHFRIVHHSKGAVRCRFWSVACVRTYVVLVRVHTWKWRARCFSKLRQNGAWEQAPQQHEKNRPAGKRGNLYNWPGCRSILLEVRVPRRLWKLNPDLCTGPWMETGRATQWPWHGAPWSKRGYTVETPPSLNKIRSSTK